MNASSSPSPDQHAYTLITWHSLLWLVISCGTGLWLATLLLIPSLGTILQPLTYGRWVTVHLNASLYGWSSIPLIGLLFWQYLPRQTKSRWAEIAVAGWSGVLLFSAIGWLSGHTSGKLFMEWSGASRWALSGGMVLLALSLAISYFKRLKEGQWEDAAEIHRPLIVIGKALLLLLLSCIPLIMFLAADPGLYPPVNPDSGGSTGGSLLGSTLALIIIYWMLPFMLDIPKKVPDQTLIPLAVILVIHFGFFAMLDHGDRSHHEPMQIIALSSLIIWPPLLVIHLRKFAWPAGSTRWLVAFGLWGATLTLNGISTFLPSILDQLKFTNALVAHVHIAMAGMITNFNMIILVAITARSRPHLFSSSRYFWFWQIGTVVHALSMLIAGMLEAAHPAWLFTSHPMIQLLYGIRWLAGLMMALSALSWWRKSHIITQAIP